MPDLDRVERSLRRLWRAPYRLLKGGHSLEAVAEELIRCAAADLREQGGVPGFEAFLQVYIAPEHRLDFMKTLGDVSRSIEQKFGQERNVKLIARAMQRGRAKIIAGQALPDPPQLAEEFLCALIRHNFFDRVNYRSVGEDRRFKDVTESRDFECRVWLYLEPQLTKLARRFAADPTASKLRAPNSLRTRLSTAELIDTPI
jgi:hypothetical protein